LTPPRAPPAPASKPRGGHGRGARPRHRAGGRRHPRLGGSGPRGSPPPPRGPPLRPPARQGHRCRRLLPVRPPPRNRPGGRLSRRRRERASRTAWGRRPIFFSVAIILLAFLPIFPLGWIAWVAAPRTPSMPPPGSLEAGPYLVQGYFCGCRFGSHTTFST